MCIRTQLETGELKVDATQAADPDLRPGYSAVQSGCYALELLSCTYGTRASCFGLTILDDEMFLWHYDACGIVYTDESLSFVDDFEDAVATIVAIVNCTAEQFGALPSSVMEPRTPYPTGFPPESLLDNTFDVVQPSSDALHVSLRQPLNIQYTITGRRSFIYTANVTPIPHGYKKDAVIVKFSYQVSTRKPENDLVARAQKCGVHHLPEIHGSRDLWLLKDRARDLTEKRKDLLSRLGLRVKGKREDPPVYEDRILRAIVYTGYLSIRDLFAEHIELVPIMVEQMIDCTQDSFSDTP